MKVDWKMWLAVGMVVACLPGLARLRFDTDVTGILPQDLPEVKGLRVMQEEFSREGEVVILLEAEDEEDAVLLPELAEGLAGHLAAEGLARNTRWRPMWEGDEAAEAAEWIAWLWLNGDPAENARWAERFADGAVDGALADALAAVASAPEGAAMVMRANDPFGLLRHPSVRYLEGLAGDGGFEGEDGLSHLILLEAPGEVAGYREAGAWMDALRGATDGWLGKHADGVRVGAKFTGGPAFAAEIGRAMERDMRGTALLTMGLVGVLFWWMQRRLRLLAGLVVMLALVFATTLGFAGWVLGELSVMTAGFAAILIGLAVDYGVLICQEAKDAPGDVVALRRAVSRSIVWAAVTTAAVFAALHFSSLPGIEALGVLVAAGILAGAVLMLAIYLPFVAKAGPQHRVGSDGGRLVPLPRRAAWVAGGALALASVGVLVWLGLPETRFDPAMMRPRESAAMDAFLRVQAGFPAAREPDARWLVTLAPGEPAAARLAALEEKAAAHGEVKAARIPHGWWPEASRQAANRAWAAETAARAENLLEKAGQAGFSDEGLALSRAVFDALRDFAAAEEARQMPGSNSFRDLTRGFMNVGEDGGGVLMIDLDLLDGVVPNLGLRGLNDDRAHVTGWEMLRPALMPMVAADVKRVFLPMLAMMAVMLCVVFRRVPDVAAVAAAMVLSGGMVLAAMAATGMSWNILNIAAAPLFLGIGIDYGIHMALALRRHGGDVRAAWHGTGKAVVFCAVSTAIGFGSLCFASNDALASLGAVSVLGIMSAMVVSVFLLPGWRSSICQRDLKAGDE
jgi:predicted exporter